MGTCSIKRPHDLLVVGPADIMVNRSVTYQTWRGLFADAQFGEDCPNTVFPPTVPYSYYKVKNELYNAIADYGIQVFFLDLNMRDPDHGPSYFGDPPFNWQWNFDFHFTSLNELFDVMHGRGMSPIWILKIVDWRTSDSYITQHAIQVVSPARYGEVIVAVWNHILAGWSEAMLPYGIAIINEPDGNTYYTASLISQCIAEAKAQLIAAGYTPPAFLAPCTRSALSAPTWWNNMTAQARSDCPVLVYHKYDNPVMYTPDYVTMDARLTTLKNASPNKERWMAEQYDSNYWLPFLMRDLQVAEASVTGRYGIAWYGTNPTTGPLFNLNTTDPQNPYIQERLPALYPLGHFVQPGAVRLECNYTLPTANASYPSHAVAFRNPDGKLVVFVNMNMTTQQEFSVSGLPAGTYGRGYSTMGTRYADMGDVVAESGVVKLRCTAGSGVMCGIVVYQK